ncbi:unnamed protein product [Adineta steineri]|uniref:Uncharacterized protein n=1 Tax=Adineta steineri TaxID=433720 RepID=A0A814EJC0_9BILA|nr:unnamed protein product [Adineta steineri]CAF4064091.1 unnamed protein product [Adineta steineri]
MSNSFRLSLLFVYIIFNNINDIRTIPQGYLLGATFELGTTSNKLYKIDPMTGVFTLFTSLDGYKPDDATYDLINKIFYIFVSGPAVRRESSMSLILVNPFNGTKQYRNIITEDYAELYGLRVDSSTGKLYSLQMSSAGEDPVSIVQIDPFNFIATRWVNITEVSGISPDSMAIFYNATNHQYFVTVVSGDNETLVGIDLIKQKIISRISNSHLPSFLCYDNKTDAFYGMQRFTGKRGCRLIRLNPYNGTLDILSDEFNDYEPSAGNCYEGYYFTMIILNSETQQILTFDLNNNGKLISNKPGEEYLSSLAFIPI